MLVVVSPETVVRWHRAGFHMYWRLLSRVQKQGGRRPVTAEIRELILKMMAEGGWGDAMGQKGATAPMAPTDTKAAMK